MEDHHYLYLGLALVSLLVVIYKLRRGPAHGHGLRLPLGPWQLPVIGSMHHLAGQLPHRAMRDQARRHGAVMLLRIGEVPTVVVSSREAACEVMKTHDAAFASRPLSATLRVITNGGRDIIFAPYGEHWRQLRKVAITELLSARRVLSFRAVREEEAAAAAAAARPIEMRARLSFRLHPPVPLLLPRECREPCRVLGYEVPRGATVLVNVWALGRDERYWPGNPEAFRPERFEDGGEAPGVEFKGTDFELLPLGGGRRMCPGMSFGLANIELALASLLFHFDWEAPGLTDPAEFDMTEAFGITMRRKANFLLRPILRVPVPGV